MAREYDEADRQYFAGFIAERDKLRPIECCGGLDCWVEFGPPAMTRQIIRDNRRIKAGGLYCVGCGGSPEIPWTQRGKPYAR